MGRLMPACVLTFGLALSACSKHPSQPAAEELRPSSPPATLVQPAAAANPSVSSAQNAITQAAPIAQSPTIPSTPAAMPATQSADAPLLVASDETQGPFHVGDQIFTLVKHIQKIQGSKSPDDSTVEWWELHDASGNPVYRQQYTVAFQNGALLETDDVGARELKTNFGHGILIEGGSLPSAPNGGWWVQVFGLFNGKLVSFSPEISADGEFLGEDVATFEATAMFRGQQPQQVSHDVLKFRAWTGNFAIEYNIIIDWMQGKVRPEWICSQLTSKGRSSACRYKVQTDPHPVGEMTFVRLFGEPDEGFTPKHVVIKPESKIEFIEAQAPVFWSIEQNNASFGVSDSEKIWLHIKVDGQDGWISGEEDFEAVGLPQSG